MDRDYFLLCIHQDSTVSDCTTDLHSLEGDLSFDYRTTVALPARQDYVKNALTL
jgi:hypothetical protein